MKLLHLLDAVPAALSRTGRVPALREGRTGERIAHILAELGGAA